jgi:hypothetical protein
MTRGTVTNPTTAGLKLQSRFKNVFLASRLAFTGEAVPAGDVESEFNEFTLVYLQGQAPKLGPRSLWFMNFAVLRINDPPRPKGLQVTDSSLGHCHSRQVLAGGWNAPHLLASSRTRRGPRIQCFQFSDLKHTHVPVQFTLSSPAPFRKGVRG